MLRVRVGGLGADHFQSRRDRGQAAARVLVARVGHYLRQLREEIKHIMSQSERTTVAVSSAL